MAKINITDLNGQTESYLVDLNETELDLSGGGIWDSIKSAVSWALAHIGFDFTDGGGILSYKHRF